MFYIQHYVNTFAVKYFIVFISKKVKLKKLSSNYSLSTLINYQAHITDRVLKQCKTWRKKEYKEYKEKKRNRKIRNIQHKFHLLKQGRSVLDNVLKNKEAVWERFELGMAKEDREYGSFPLNGRKGFSSRRKVSRKELCSIREQKIVVSYMASGEKWLSSRRGVSK